MAGSRSGAWMFSDQAIENGDQPLCKRGIGGGGDRGDHDLTARSCRAIEGVEELLWVYSCLR